jgi:small-conductance mechanosensitive channel
MQIPAPTVAVAAFTANTVDFEILFWIPEVDDAIRIRDNIMQDIYNEFTKNGIPLAHP